MAETLDQSPLGKPTTFENEYQADLLCAIPRQKNRDALSLPSPLPFDGVDIWNAYELSWLNSKGKPLVAVAEFYIPCTTPNIIESKSFKLYLNSLNQTSFASKQVLKETLETDLSMAAGKPVRMKVIEPALYQHAALKYPDAICLDELDIEITDYEVIPDYLQCGQEFNVSESLYTHLFKSNCPVTNQPDWASIFIRYEGRNINHAGLLRYLVSYRDHNGFHEDCIERIFMDISRHCQPEKLTVYGRFTRRGGLDINPFRSNYELSPNNYKTFRQ